MKIDELPFRGFKGLSSHWREDLLAAFSVTLVALPMALGIAIASGFPPVSGLISAVVAGLVTTLIRGSYVSIHGPAAGMIVVIFSSLQLLDDGSGQALNYMTAAFIMAGLIQVILGLLRFGKYGDFFPSAVIHGMLAAIGVIIFAKQAHEALGVKSSTNNAFDTLLEIPASIMQLNPAITFIALTSLFILIIYPKIKSKLVKLIPAPMWVLFVAIPLVFAFGMLDNHQYSFLGQLYSTGPEYLIEVKPNLFDEIFFPNFAMIGTGKFWLAVISICLIGSLETLIVAKAVDKLDPYQRKTWLNRELIGVGISTMTAGLIGGIPSIPFIINSSVNVNNGGKTRWSNFFHAIILVLLVLVFPRFIQIIPLAALAAILVFTGYKLASPRLFKEHLRKGPEQLFIFIITLIVSLVGNLIWGIAVGVLTTLVIHYFKTGIPLKKFINYITNPFTKVIQEKNNSYLLKVKGVSNFFNIIHVIKTFAKLPEKKRIVVDFSHARLIDFTVLEYLHEFAEEYERQGGLCDLVGLDIHEASSNHPLALRVMIQEKKIIRLTRRQLKIKKMAAENNLPYQPEISYDVSSLKEFLFFKSRPIQYKKNIVRGYDAEFKVNWEISDITFDIGALLAAETYHTTIETIDLPMNIPVFSLEKEVFYDKILELAGVDDIDFKDHKEFSDRFALKGPNEEAIRKFFTPDIIQFFEKMDIYHLESSGNSLLIFKYIRLASPSESMKMYHYSRQLVRRLKKKFDTDEETVEKINEPT